MERPDYAALAEILKDMNAEGGYKASILARDDGLLIASAIGTSTNREVAAAMAGYVAATIERMRNELSLGDLRDITVRCTEGKAVFRKIVTDREAFILAAIMPRSVRYHARALGKASTRISRIFRQK